MQLSFLITPPTCTVMEVKDIRSCKSLALHYFILLFFGMKSLNINIFEEIVAN